MNEWMRLAGTSSIVHRSIKVAVVVGIILIVINHGDAIMRGDISAGRLFKMALTFFVPYAVSTHAAVSAIREHTIKEHPAAPASQRG